MKSVNSIFPTIEKDDISFFIKNIFSNKNSYKSKIEIELKKYFPDSTILFFESGRAGLDFLASFLPKDSNIYMQAFTCSAVAYPFLKNGISPTYIDIDTDSYNMSFTDLQNKRKSKHSALLVQHTFGIKPKKLESILQFAKENNLILIEDLAHSFGNVYKKNYLGTFGDVALLSFGRDKVISSVAGGALIINNKELSRKLIESYSLLPEVTITTKIKLVFYLFFMTFAKSYFNFKLTRICIYFFQKIGLLDKAVSEDEKSLQTSHLKPKKFPMFLFPLLFHQLLKLPDLTKKREEITAYYNKKYKTDFDGALLKYPLEVNQPNEYIKNLRKEHMYLDRWYSHIIDPIGVDLFAYEYKNGSCPNAEEVAKGIINLPTLWKFMK